MHVEMVVTSHLRQSHASCSRTAAQHAHGRNRGSHHVGEKAIGIRGWEKLCQGTLQRRKLLQRRAFSGSGRMPFDCSLTTVRSEVLSTHAHSGMFSRNPGTRHGGTDETTPRTRQDALPRLPSLTSCMDVVLRHGTPEFRRRTRHHEASVACSNLPFLALAFWQRKYTQNRQWAHCPDETKVKRLPPNVQKHFS
jgi:hypothetical protein